MDNRRLWHSRQHSLLAAPSRELVFRESPIGEHATSGAAESSVREAKRQPRTSKFALEVHVSAVANSHPHFEVEANDGGRCFQFRQD